MGKDLEVFHHACCEALLFATGLIRLAKTARVKIPAQLSPKALSEREFSDIKFAYGLSLHYLTLGVQGLCPLITWIPDTALEAITSLSEDDKKDYFDESPTRPIGLPSAQYHRCVREFSKVCPSPIRIGPLYATSYHEAAATYSLRVINVACCEYWGGSLLDLVVLIRQIPEEGLADFFAWWRNYLMGEWESDFHHPGYGYWWDGYLLNDGDTDSPTGDHSYEVNEDRFSMFEMAMKKELYLIDVDYNGELESADMQSPAPSANSDVNREPPSDNPLTTAAPDGPIPPSSFQWRGERTKEKLTKKEYKLLVYVFERKENPPTVDELMKLFWTGPYGDRNNYDTYASKLRKKLNPIGVTIETDNGHACFRPLPETDPE